MKPQPLRDSKEDILEPIFQITEASKIWDKMSRTKNKFRT